MSIEIKKDYTYASVAKAAGVTTTAVRKYFTRNELDFGDIKFVACYIAGCLLGNEKNG